MLLRGSLVVAPQLGLKLDKDKFLQTAPRRAPVLAYVPRGEAADLVASLAPISILGWATSNCQDLWMKIF